MATQERFDPSKGWMEADLQDKRMKSDLDAFRSAKDFNEDHPEEKPVSGLDVLNQRARFEDLKRKGSIKVLRTSGEMEDGWLAIYFDEQKGLVSVINEEHDIRKKVSLSDLADWNS